MYFLPLIILIKEIDLNFFLFIILLVILVLFSAMMSAAEVSYFALNDKDLNHIRKKNHPSEYRIFKLLEKPKELLATILIGNNLGNISTVILFTIFINTYYDFSSYRVLAYIVEIVLITFIIVVFSELVPKIYANQNRLKISESMSLPLTFLVRILKPLNKVLVKSTGIIEKRLQKKRQNLSLEEIHEVIDIAGHQDSQAEDKKILKRIVNFSNVYVRQIMTPRMDVVTCEYSTPFTKVFNDININRFSRIPVYKNNLDQIAGILYIKDLLPYFEKDDSFKWQNLIRKAYFVPENKKIDDLLREFQSKKVHLAVVVDEYGGFSGVISLEDILEEIVGEIRDEFDEPVPAYQKAAPNTYIFDAKTSLSDMIKVLNLQDDFFDPYKGEAETIGGLIIEVLGKIPQKGENITIDNIELSIESADNRRVKQVKVKLG